MKSNSLLIVISLMSFISSIPAASKLRGGEAAPPPEQPAKEPSAFDRLWGLATLYKDEGNPFVQEIKLRGRYHGQFFAVDSEQGSTDAWEDRRYRLGLQIKFLKEFEFVGEMTGSDDFDPFYNGLTDLYVKWRPNEAFNLTVGKQKPQFTYDWLQSSNVMPTFERWQLFNQSRIDRAPGVVINGKVDHWTYEAGVYSNAVDLEFGHFDGGWSSTAGIGYDFKDAWGLTKADWRIDYLHSEIGFNDTVNSYWTDAVATGIQLKQGMWGLTAETMLGFGDRGDAFGLYVQPTYDLSKRLQLVGRYSFAVGDDDVLVAQRRYERAAPRLGDGGKGDLYHAGYLGLQYFIYGDKLKLMAGAEYAHLDGGRNGGDYDGWTFLGGLRFSF